MLPREELSSQRPALGQTLVDLLHERARASGEKPAFIYLGADSANVDGEQHAPLTYGQLHQRAKAIAAELQSLIEPGERAVLLFPPGLDFIAAFFGCLYAGVIAVPAAIPSRNRLTTLVESIFQASKPAVVLSTTAHIELAARTYAASSGLSKCRWIAVDQICDTRQEAWRDPQVSGRQIAFLQYTSGSTSEPKGVMLSHHQLLYNASLVQKAFHTNPEILGVFWLPLYHDMGLIGGVIQPIYCGGSSTLIAPTAFLQRPSIWLETISRTRATISGGPDFAYDLCARKVSAEERSRLDLSSWDLAFIGAERVRPQTAERFIAAFSGCGFRREALFPCYGLAEATLLVSGGPRQAPPVVLAVDSESLTRNEIEITTAEDDACHLMACGENLPGQRILIVNPQSCLRLVDGRIGEIWVQGPSVASGYFENPQATDATFCAWRADIGEGPFLRTGDLGFLCDGQLYVTGRLKNLIIIRGRNHYPEDIEHTIQSAYDGLRAGYCAAFSVEVDNRDQLVVVQEIEPRHRDLDTVSAIRAIRAVIAGRHELEVHAVVLVKAGNVPNTSSGKTRRAACRERYLQGELEIVAAWEASQDEVASDLAEDSLDLAPREVPAAEIEAWLVDRIMARLRLAPGDVKITTPFLELGMGSLDAVEIAAALERWLGRRLSPTAIYNYPTIAALAHWLAMPVTTSESKGNAPANMPIFPPASLNSEQLLAEVRTMSDRDIEGFLASELAKLPVK